MNKGDRSICGGGVLLRVLNYAIFVLASALLASCNQNDADKSPKMPFPAIPLAQEDSPQTPPPSKDAVWLPASYEWTGKTYALQPGSWVESVPPTAVWQAGHWVLGQDNVYMWVKGHWVQM